MNSLAFDVKHSRMESKRKSIAVQLRIGRTSFRPNINSSITRAKGPNATAISHRSKRDCESATTPKPHAQEHGAPHTEGRREGRRGRGPARKEQDFDRNCHTTDLEVRQVQIGAVVGVKEACARGGSRKYRVQNLEFKIIRPKIIALQ